jgi:hypothetical protein
LYLSRRKWREAGENCIMRRFITCASPDIITVIKSRRINEWGHAIHMGEMRNVYKFWSENLKGRDYLEDLDVDGMVISEWILGKQDGKNVEWLHLVQDRDQW